MSIRIWKLKFCHNLLMSFQTMDVFYTHKRRHLLIKMNGG